MKQFESPQVEIINDLTEGVYADSGAVVTPTPGGYIPPDNGVTCTTEGWAHNGGSGSHFHCHIIYQGADISKAKITTKWTTGFKINALHLESSSGSGILTKDSDYSFTLSVTDCWNGSHNSDNAIYITGNTIYGSDAIGVSGDYNTNEYTNSIICNYTKIERVFI